jgi:hypothetical protein
MRPLPHQADEMRDAFDPRAVLDRPASKYVAPRPTAARRSIGTHVERIAGFAIPMVSVVIFPLRVSLTITTAQITFSCAIDGEVFEVVRGKRRSGQRVLPRDSC